MGPGARVGPTSPRLLPARAGAPPWSRPWVRLARLAADGAWAAARGALSLRASGGVGAAADPRRVPDCDRAGAKRRRHHVLPEAAQTHLQVLPPAAAPGKHPLPTRAPALAVFVEPLSGPAAAGNSTRLSSWSCPQPRGCQSPGAGKRALPRGPTGSVETCKTPPQPFGARRPVARSFAFRRHLRRCSEL